MKKTILTLLSAVSLVSCATGPNAQTGAVLGALGGAAVGGIIGNQSGRGLEGAAIGAGLGALGGNALGNSKDQNNARYQQGYYDKQGPLAPRPAAAARLLRQVRQLPLLLGRKHPSESLFNEDFVGQAFCFAGYFPHDPQPD
jgi:uncharacterized membrane protein YebE (DUF533 family)